LLDRPATAGHDRRVQYVTADALESGLEHIRRSPADHGRVELIVRRPAEGEREVIVEAALDCVEGLVGDTWRVRGSNGTADGSAHPGRQLTVMNVRFAALVAGDPDRRPLAGDQLFVDLDLSEDNISAGTRLALGSAVIEVTDQPHLGCQKFSARFGLDAFRLVNSPVGRQLRLRGANARVVAAGPVRQGDVIQRLTHEPGA
jgi:hypothetical protein